jgi:hypothetical protein
MDNIKECKEENCKNTDNVRTLNPTRLAELKKKRAAKGLSADPHQEVPAISKEGLINPDVIKELSAGCSAILILDNGKNMGCFVQRISKPAAIGAMTIFLEKFIEEECKP